MDVDDVRTPSSMSSIGRDAKLWAARKKIKLMVTSPSLINNKPDIQGVTLTRSYFDESAKYWLSYYFSFRL